jgi:hypothetical protein
VDGGSVADWSKVTQRISEVYQDADVFLLDLIVRHGDETSHPPKPFQISIEKDEALAASELHLINRPLCHEVERTPSALIWLSRLWESCRSLESTSRIAVTLQPGFERGLDS